MMSFYIRLMSWRRIKCRCRRVIASAICYWAILLSLTMDKGEWHPTAQFHLSFQHAHEAFVISSPGVVFVNLATCHLSIRSEQADLDHLLNFYGASRGPCNRTSTICSPNFVVSIIIDFRLAVNEASGLLLSSQWISIFRRHLEIKRDEWKDFRGLLRYRLHFLTKF